MTVATSPGQFVSHYRILERIGAGGMGVVYKADDTNLERTVALKFLPPELTIDTEAKARFVREARAASHLDHPNICTIHEIGDTDDGQTYIAMSFYDGETLKARLDRGPIPPPEALKIAEQIARGLAKAHASGVVHRDIKPANVIVTSDGIVKILDFGLAKLSGATAITRENRILGTLAYMAPEQLRGEEVGAAADLWSLGAVLYEMLTARRAFAGDSQQAIMHSIFDGRPAELSAYVSAAPERLKQIIGKLLEKKISDRYRTADELLADLDAIRVSQSGARDVTRHARPASRARIGGLILLVVIALVAAALAYVALQRHASRRAWLANEAIPQMEALLENGQNERGDFWVAYLLARKIEKVSPSDPYLAKILPLYTRKLTIRSTPPGAAVYVRYYGEPQGAPLSLGKTPLEAIDFARGFFRFRIEAPGFVPVDDLVSNFGTHPGTLEYALQKEGSIPAGMQSIPEGRSYLWTGVRPSDGGPPERDVPAFLMDRREVTNREFKRFIDEGGYRNPKFWRGPFVEGGRALGWQEAMNRFRDRTGFPGPAGWELGTYPEGTADHPVGGVSWYEAAGYASWSGKELPTIYHWQRVAATEASGIIIPMSNFNGRGPRLAGTAQGMTRFGVVDLAGNVREWSFTTCAEGEVSDRYLLGGGWSDPGYMFFNTYTQSPFDRDPANGFRCMRYVDPAGRSMLEAPVLFDVRDYRKETPASDEVFAIYRRQFAYDEAPLDARVEAEKRLGYATRYKVSFRAAYEGPRMVAYLYVPATGRAPYQAVIVFPGSNAVRATSIEEASMPLEFFLRSGRAVVFPVYRYTFERGGGRSMVTDQAETALYRDWLVMCGKDLSRTIDYLETRNDIDTEKLAFAGWSWGARLGALLPAVENRIRANILVLGGFNFQRALPEAEGINYVSRVTQPTLMLNGRYDSVFPLETSQRPMFEMLGTPPADKKWVTYPGGHSIPKTELVRETLAWLDRHLGPVAAN